MICINCNKSFEILKTHGGQNRLLCYDCVPLGLDQKERERLIRLHIRNKINNQKISIGCKRCGYNKCAEALEWHHPNQDKDNNPADLLSKRGFVCYYKYLEEIQKCELLCANCHREEHFMGD